MRLSVFPWAGGGFPPFCFCLPNCEEKMFRLLPTLLLLALAMFLCAEVRGQASGRSHRRRNYQVIPPSPRPHLP